MVWWCEAGKVHYLPRVFLSKPHKLPRIVFVYTEGTYLGILC